MEWFIFFLVAGIVLFCVEIFVPGGVLGVIAGFFLLAAMIVALVKFPVYGPHIAVGIIVLVVVSMGLWLGLLPHTLMGRSMTLTRDGSDFHVADESLRDLQGQAGQAVSDLRPAGFALIAGRRVDVVTEGSMISKGAAVTVVQVEGNRVVVRQSEQVTS